MVRAGLRRELASITAFPETAMRGWAAEKGRVTGRTAFECAKARDKIAVAVRDRYIESVAEGIVGAEKAAEQRFS